MITYDIESGLKALWEPVVNQQIDLKLHALQHKIRRLNITLKQTTEAINAQVVYHCQIGCTDNAGRSTQIATAHGLGEVAITDAFSRIRRTLLRTHLDTRHTATNQPESGFGQPG